MNLLLPSSSSSSSSSSSTPSCHQCHPSLHAQEDSSSISRSFLHASPSQQSPAPSPSASEIPSHLSSPFSSSSSSSRSSVTSSSSFSSSSFSVPWWLRRQLSGIRGRLLHAAVGTKTPSTYLSSLPPEATAGLGDDDEKQEEELDDSIASTSVTTTTTKTSEGGGERGGEHNKGGRTRREVEEAYPRRREGRSLQSSSLSEYSSHYGDHASERERRQRGVTGRFLGSGREGKVYGSRSIYDESVRRRHQMRDEEEEEENEKKMKSPLQSIQGEGWVLNSHLRRRGSREEDQWMRYDVRGEGGIKERAGRGRGGGGERRKRTTRRERSESQESSWSDVLCEVEVQARNQEGLQDHHEDLKKENEAGEKTGDEEETSFFPFRMIGFKGRKRKTEKETNTEPGALSCEGKEGEELKKEEEEPSGSFSSDRGKEVRLQERQGDGQQTERRPRTSDQSRAVSVENMNKIEEEDHHDNEISSVVSRRINGRSGEQEEEDDWSHRLRRKGKSRPSSSSRLTSHSLPSSSSSSSSSLPSTPPSSPSFPYFVYSYQGHQPPPRSLPLPPSHLLPSPYRPSHSPPPFLSGPPSTRRPPPPSRHDPSACPMYHHTNYLSPPTSAFTSSSTSSSSGRSDRLGCRKISSEEVPHGRRGESCTSRYAEESPIDVSSVSRGEGGSKKDRGHRRFSSSTAPFFDSFPSSSSSAPRSQQSYLRYHEYLWYQYYSQVQATKGEHSYKESLLDRTDTEAISSQLGEGGEKKNEAGEKENKEIKESLFERTMRSLGRRRKQESAVEGQGQEQEEEGATASRSVCFSVATTHRGRREETKATREEEEEENELANFFFGEEGEASSSNEEKGHHVSHLESSSQECDVDRNGSPSSSHSSQPPFVLHNVSYTGHPGGHTPPGLPLPSRQPFPSHAMNHQCLPPGSLGGSYPSYLPPSPFVFNQHPSPSFSLPHHLPSSSSRPPYFGAPPPHMPYPPCYYYHSNCYPSSVSPSLPSSSSLPGYSSSYPYNLHSDKVDLRHHPSLPCGDAHATDRNKSRYSKSSEETRNAVSKGELSCHGNGENKVPLDSVETRKKINERERGEEEKKEENQICREHSESEQGDDSFFSALFSSKRVGILPPHIGWASDDNNRGEKNSIDVVKPNKGDRETKRGEEEKVSPRPSPIILKMPSWDDDISVENEREKKENEKSSSESLMKQERKGMTTPLSSSPIPSHSASNLLPPGSVNIAKFSPCTPEGRSDPEGEDVKTLRYLGEKRSSPGENEEKTRRRFSFPSEDHVEANQATTEEKEGESRSFTHSSLPGKLVFLEKVVCTLFVPSSSTSASSSSSGSMKGRRTGEDTGDQDSSSRSNGRLSYLLGGGGSREGEEHEADIFSSSSSSSSSSSFHLLPPPDVDFDVCTDNPIDPSVLVDRIQQGNEDKRLFSRFLHAATSTTTVHLLSARGTSSLSLMPSSAHRTDATTARGRKESPYMERDNLSSHSSLRERGKASQKSYYRENGSFKQEREREEFGDSLHTCEDVKGKFKMDWRHLLFHRGKEESHDRTLGGGEQEEDELYVITWGCGGSGGAKDRKGSKDPRDKLSKGLMTEEERAKNDEKVMIKKNNSYGEDREKRRIPVSRPMKEARDVEEGEKDLIKISEKRREDSESKQRTLEKDERSFFPWWSPTPPSVKEARGDHTRAVKILGVKEKRGEEEEEEEDLLKKEKKKKQKQTSRERLRVDLDREEEEEGKRRSRRKEHLRGSGSEAEESGRIEEEDKRDVKNPEDEKEVRSIEAKSIPAVVACEGYLKEVRGMRRDNCRDRLMVMIKKDEEERRRLKERRRKWKRRHWGLRIERRDHGNTNVLYRQNAVPNDHVTEKKEEEQGEEKEEEGEEEGASFEGENADGNSQKSNVLQRDLRDGSDGIDQKVKRSEQTRERYSPSVLPEKDMRREEARSQQGEKDEKEVSVAREADERERPSLNEEEKDEREKKEAVQHEEEEDENKRCKEEEEEEVLIFMEPCDEAEREEEKEDNVSGRSNYEDMHNTRRKRDEETPRMKERGEDSEKGDLGAKKETRDVTADQEEKEKEENKKEEETNGGKEEHGGGLVERERGDENIEVGADREEGERLRDGDSSELVIYLNAGDLCINQKPSVSHAQQCKSLDKPFFFFSSSSSLLSSSFEESAENSVCSSRAGKNRKKKASPSSSSSPLSFSSHESKELSHSPPRERLSHSTPSPSSLSLPPAAPRKQRPSSSSSSDVPPLSSFSLSHRHSVSSLTPSRTSPRCSSSSSSSSSYFSPSLPEGLLTVSSSSSSSSSTARTSANSSSSSSTSSSSLPHPAEPSSSCPCSSLPSKSSPWKMFLQDAMNRSLSALTATASQAASLLASEASKTFLPSSSSHDLPAPPHGSSSLSSSPAIPPSRTGGVPRSSLCPTPRPTEEIQSCCPPQHLHERDLLHRERLSQEKDSFFCPSSSARSSTSSSSCDRMLFVSPTVEGEVNKEQEHRDGLPLLTSSASPPLPPPSSVSSSSSATLSSSSSFSRPSFSLFSSFQGPADAAASFPSVKTFQRSPLPPSLSCADPASSSSSSWLPLGNEERQQVNDGEDIGRTTEGREWSRRGEKEEETLRRRSSSPSCHVSAHRDQDFEEKEGRDEEKKRGEKKREEALPREKEEEDLTFPGRYLNGHDLVAVDISQPGGEPPEKGAKSLVCDGSEKNMKKTKKKKESSLFSKKREALHEHQLLLMLQQEMLLDQQDEEIS